MSRSIQPVSRRREVPAPASSFVEPDWPPIIRVLDRLLDGKITEFVYRWVQF